jgi:hypothetical protein
MNKEYAYRLASIEQVAGDRMGAVSWDRVILPGATDMFGVSLETPTVVVIPNGNEWPVPLPSDSQGQPCVVREEGPVKLVEIRIQELHDWDTVGRVASAVFDLAK